MCSKRNRGRRDVPQGKDCPFCSLLPALPVVVVMIVNLCGDNTNLVEAVGGLKRKMLESKHVCIFIALKK